MCTPYVIHLNDLPQHMLCHVGVRFFLLQVSLNIYPLFLDTKLLVFTLPEAFEQTRGSSLIQKTSQNCDYGNFGKNLLHEP